MTSPAPNLSKLRLISAVIAVLLVAVIVYFRRGSVPTVQTIVATATALPPDSVVSSSKVTVNGDRRFVPPRISVPAEAVTQLDGKSIVWVVRDERLESRLVDAGPVSGGVRDIRTGLSGGELVLTGGVANPREGMRVKVQ